MDVEEHADANLSSSERSNNLDLPITAPPRAAARNPQVKPKKIGAKWPSAAVYVTRASERKGRLKASTLCRVSLQLRRRRSQTRRCHFDINGPSGTRLPLRVAGMRVAQSAPTRQSCSDDVTGSQKHTHTQKNPTFTDVKKCGSRTHRAPARTDKNKESNKSATWTRLKDSPPPVKKT